MWIVIPFAVVVAAAWLFLIAGYIVRSTGNSMAPTCPGTSFHWILRWTPPGVGDVVSAMVRFPDHRPRDRVLHRVIASDGELALLCGDDWAGSEVELVPIGDIEGVVVGARNVTIAGMIWELLGVRAQNDVELRQMMWLVTEVE